MSREIKIGPYSAYAIAVKYGYQGTEEEWVKEQEQSRVDAKQSAVKAENAAKQAQASQAAAEEAKGNALQAISASKDSALSDMEKARTGALSDINGSRTEALDNIGTSRADALKAVTDARTAAVTAVSDQQTAALDGIQSAGSTALTDISNKRADAIAAVETAGQKTLDSIPEDYTDMADRVEKLEQTKAEIDDTAVGPDTWSAKHIVDMLCPPIEETGNPVQMSGILPGYPLGVTASWEPTQDGEGDPSPDNIRPIRGRDSVSVTRCGENLAMDVPLNPTASCAPIYHQPLQKETVSLSFHLKGSFDPSTSAAAIVDFYDSINKVHHYWSFRQVCAQNGIDWTTGTVDADFKLTVTATFDRIDLYFVYPGFARFTIDSELTNFMLVYSSSPAAYIPYTGQTTTLTLPSSICGGSVDAVTGEGQKEWEIITITGAENWRLEERTFLCSPGIVSYSSEKMLASCAVFSPTNPSADFRVQILGATLYFYAKPFSNANELKQYLAAQYAAGSPMQVAYTLAEPQPFTAAGAQPVPALSGVNTITTDADVLTVTGRADPIKRITDLEDAVASMTTNE